MHRILSRSSSTLSWQTSCRALHRLAISLSLGLAMLAPPAFALDFPYTVPLHSNASGTLTISTQLGSSTAEFLLDTGAGIVTIGSRLLDELHRQGSIQPSHRMALRLANNRVQAVQVYRVESLRVGGHCELGPLDVAVLPGESRNLLGLSALNKTAPFAVDVRASTLLLSHCGAEKHLAGLN
ncbi:MAG: aspartyl protease family protein [Parahaliea sp.]